MHRIEDRLIELDQVHPESEQERSQPLEFELETLVNYQYYVGQSRIELRSLGQGFGFKPIIGETNKYFTPIS